MMTEPMESGASLPILGEGSSPGEMKAVLAAAMKLAAEKELAGAPDPDTPVEELCDSAGCAVEEAKAMQQLADEQITVSQAMDMAGRATVAAAWNGCTRFLQSAASAVPIVGPLLSVFSGILFARLRTSQFTETVYTTVKTTAVTAWGWVKEKATGIKNRITNKVASWLHI